MASVQIEPAYGDQALARRPLIAAIRWEAVLAGVVVGISVQLALSLLGVATGLSATDVSTMEGAALGRGALMWAGVSMLIAALTGGYVAARMSGLKRKADGVLHGVVSWSVTTLLFATLATTATGNMLGTMFSSIDPGAVVSRVASGDAGAAAGRMADLIRSQSGVNVTADNLRILQQAIAAGQRDQAVQYMVSAMGIEPGRAATIVDQGLIVSGSPGQASSRGQAQANQALDRAGLAAWTVFGAVALSLVLAIIGGLLGSLGSRRTTWNDEIGPLAMASTARPASTTTRPGPSVTTTSREPGGRDPLNRDPV
ncbi:MAG: hypothetical protein Q7U14_12520 [Lacisediminimonas sp.]|nr:hypothetical protein [Lacisediminimonas sp.]